ncbi:MAG: T9SS type A sorting domain-containing protein [Rubricoccaceae bacterium]
MLTAAVTLLSSALALLTASSPQPATHFASCDTPTGAGATVLFPAPEALLVAGAPLAAGDEIAAIRPDGSCAGLLVWSGEAGSLTAWLDDPFTPEQDGFLPGEAIRFAVWRAATQQEHRDDVQFAFEGSDASGGTFRADGLYELRALQATRMDGHAPLAFGLEPNFPNPASYRTTLVYTLDRPGHVTLELFDLLGRRLRTLSEQHHEAGRHTFLLEVDDLPAGTYLYRLREGEQSAQRRLVITR